MTNMDSKQWLLAMELFDNDYGVTKDSKIVNDTIMNMKKILTNKERYEIRKVKALEIIAEELIKHNETSGCIVTALENLETTLNRR